MASKALEKFRGLLNELFLLNEPELDFGIYRVMNARRREVERFRDQELERVVTEALSRVQDVDRAALETQLSQARAHASALGVDPDATPRVQELKAQIAAAARVSEVSDEVFAHLHAFFSRYYQAGDFHCRRLFREGAYAIPYEGEEVRLFWANADQYYIKSTQRLNPWEFTLPGDARRVRFEVVGGSEERDNTKSARVFQLAAEAPFVTEGGLLTVRFVYRSDAHEVSQDEHDARVAVAVGKDPALAEWARLLLAVNGDGSTTRLAKQLRRFRQRETFDYFIHKNLRRFLRQELDYYLKTEVMRLDDIGHASAPRVEEYLSAVRAIHTLGQTLIEFVAQLEDFQKRLWLKKKFVLDTHWLVSVGMIPRSLWPRVLQNDRQRAAWVQWLAIDKVTKDLEREGFEDPLTGRFLEQNPSLVLDTSFFDADFTADLLTALGDLEERSLGLLVHGENFQALQLLQERFRGKIKCIYIDPPYNTGNDGFAYKDNYQHSSWLSMMENRLQLASGLMPDTGCLQISIDDSELHELLTLALHLGFIHIATVVIQSNPRGRMLDTHLAKTHEYLVVLARKDLPGVTRKIPKDERMLAEYSAEDEIGFYRPIELRIRNPAFTPENRSGQWFALYVDPDACTVSLTKDARHSVEVWPTNSDNEPSVWSWTAPKVKKEGEILYARKVRTGNWRIFRKDRLPPDGATTKAKTIWMSSGLNYESGRDALSELFGKVPFAFPKPVELLREVVAIGASQTDYVLDYHAGSGTTAHAVLSLEQGEIAGRQFLLVEAGEHFDTVLKPRVMKVMHSRDWKDGVPVSRQGTQGIVQVLRLESYDDTLDNLESRIEPAQQPALFGDQDGLTPFGRDYLLKYMLQHSTQGSPSLLDPAALERPFTRTLRVTLGGRTDTRQVDVPETFHWLLGMTVSRRERTASPEVRVSWGTLPDGRSAVTVWRDASVLHGTAFDDWFLTTLRARLADIELVFVNGDQQWEKFRPADHRWQVRRSEYEFVERMFPAEG